MTTSDPTLDALDLNPGFDWSGAAAAVAAGLPDPAVLTRMANAFVNGGSGAVPVPNAPAPELGVLSLLASNGIPGDTALRNVANSSVPTTATPVLSPTAPAAPVHALPTPAAVTTIPGGPGIPGGFAGVDQVTPAFSFLQDARALFSPTAIPGALPTSVPGVPSTSTVIPTGTTSIAPDTALRDLPTTVPGTAIPSSASSLPTTTTAPQIPGTVARADQGQPQSYAFLDQLRPLVAVNTVPALAPVGDGFNQPIAADRSVGLFDVNAIRRDFPILNEQVNGRKLVWLDNAATTQKPQSVIDRLSYFYQHENSNIHRAAHTLAARSTDAYEGAREKVRRFINAGSVDEIIFVRGATEGINLIAQSWGRRHIQKDDEIVISWLEHHANIVPWQMLCAEKGARLRVAPVDDSGQIIVEEYEKLLNPRTKLVSITQVSNALGTVTPVAQLVEIAHRHGAKVVIDGAQAISHMQINVQAYDCDFYVFSGHKMFAPTGIGVVYGTAETLAQTPPWQGGGNMIADVTFERTLYHPPPGRFEAGTGNIADAIGLGAAIDYLEKIGMANVSRYEHDLLVYGTEALKGIPGLRLVGTAREKTSVLSFVLDGFTTQQVGEHLSREGIAVRSGHHCAQPILRRYGLESTVRPSLAFYNTCEEIDALVTAVWNLKQGRHPGL